MNTKDVNLTPDLLERLKQAGALGVSVKREFKYVPSTYRIKDENGEYLIPKSLWPVFDLRGLTGTESAMLEDRMQMNYDTSKGVSNIQMNSGTLKVEICRDGIISWRNLRDEDGNLMAKPKIGGDGKISDDDLGRLSSQLMTEISNAITERNKISEDEALGLD